LIVVKIHLLHGKIPTGSTDSNLLRGTKRGLLWQSKKSAQFNWELDLASTASENRVGIYPQNSCISDSASHISPRQDFTSAPCPNLSE